jgi:predicted HNH restriction endonuclease
MRYIILTENDESDWDDETGVKYHYPAKYKRQISSGDKFIYYKGAVKDSLFNRKRLSDKPHYFGAGTIDIITHDTSSNSYFAHIVDYFDFLNPVHFKIDNFYFEPNANLYYKNNSKGNYFRGNAVREIDEETYKRILSNVINFENKLLSRVNRELTTIITEGKKIKFYTTKYERSKSNRDAAIKVHGTKCKVCEFDFEKKYGEIGKSFIHVHHINPLHSLEEEIVINPVTDLVPVCPNCHAMIHRRKDRVLTVEELKQCISIFDL